MVVRRVLEVAGCAGFAAFIFLPFVDDRVVVFSLAQSAPPAIWLFGMAVGIGYLYERSVRQRVSELALLALLVVGLVSLQQLAGTKAAAEVQSTEQLTVVSWNTEYWDQDKDLNAFKSQLAALDADVLFLQEHIHWDNAQDEVRPIERTDVLADCCGYEYIETAGELVVASRFPSRAEPTGNDYVQVVEIDAPLGQLRAINVHLPVHVTLLSSPLSSEFYDYTRNALASRQDAVRTAEHHIVGRQHVVLGGDFNATALSPSTRSLLRPLDVGLVDLFASSFPTRSPLWRLDHLATTSDLHRRCRVLDLNDALSDHKPVSCDLGRSAT